jgi:hypothetical protein
MDNNRKIVEGAGKEVALKASRVKGLLSLLGGIIFPFGSVGKTDITPHDDKAYKIKLIKHQIFFPPLCFRFRPGYFVAGFHKSQVFL